ncbi:MAG: hypothetical protein Q9160_009198 [Pyrenula sp. 1 TL-2023]
MILHLTGIAARWCRETSIGLGLRNEDIEFDLSNMMLNMQPNYRRAIAQKLAAIWVGINFEDDGVVILCDNYRRVCQNEFHEQFSISHPLHNVIYIVSGSFQFLIVRARQSVTYYLCGDEAHHVFQCPAFWNMETRHRLIPAETFQWERLIYHMAYFPHQSSTIGAINERQHFLASVTSHLVKSGTKGKGSTCAFIESFLRAHGRRHGRPLKTGLYTSPHLIYPEERIRLNFIPLSRDLFARYFFEIYDALDLAKQDRNRAEEPQPQPRYLQLLSLLSFHTFIREAVDVAVLETHHGGEFDVTNIVEHPVVTAITSLGMDHVNQLGPSIENIAWHKAGIFKRGARAVSAPQEREEAKRVLRERAGEKGVELAFVGNDDGGLPKEAMRLMPRVQRVNCQVAMAAVRAFLEKADATLEPEDVEEGLTQFAWPGRFQVVAEEGKGMQWFLDGAHNEMSIEIAAEWFVQASRIQESRWKPASKVLIFSQISDQRDSVAVFERLANSLSPVTFQRAIFTTYDLKQDIDSVLAAQPKLLDPDFQDAYAKIWNTTHPGSEVIFEPTIQQALEAAREVRGGEGLTQTLITGSQHLVGGALYVLEREKLSQKDSA